MGDPFLRVLEDKLSTRIREWYSLHSHHSHLSSHSVLKNSYSETHFLTVALQVKNSVSVLTALSQGRLHVRGGPSGVPGRLWEEGRGGRGTTLGPSGRFIPLPRVPLGGRRRSLDVGDGYQWRRGGVRKLLFWRGYPFSGGGASKWKIVLTLAHPFSGPGPAIFKIWHDVEICAK